MCDADGPAAAEASVRDPELPDSGIAMAPGGPQANDAAVAMLARSRARGCDAAMDSGCALTDGRACRDEWSARMVGSDVCRFTATDVPSAHRCWRRLEACCLCARWMALGRSFRQVAPRVPSAAALAPGCLLAARIADRQGVDSTRRHLGETQGTFADHTTAVSHGLHATLSSHA